ncbi:MAG: flagellar hook-length control protein FliK [Oscillospiraceae bacterium]
MESFRVQQDIAMGKPPMKTGAKNQQAIVNGDFFAAFLQLITQSGEECDLDILSQISDSDTDSNAAAMEMMADLFNGNFGFDWLMANNHNNETVNSEFANNAKMFGEMMMAQNGNIAKFSMDELNAILSNGIQTSSQKTKQFDTFGFQRQMQGFGDTKQMQLETVLNTANSEESESSSELLFNGNMNFQNAVMQAQKLMKGQSKESMDSLDDLSADALQQAIGQSKFDTVLNEKQMSTTAQTPLDITDLAQQVKNGLSNSALGNQKEFSVKLKPEGLGEVTIKLMESQSKLSVSIVTATSEVAKLLNNELSTLRETMRAMQIEVKDVIVQPQNDFGSMQQNLQQQMFQGQSNQFGENRHTNRSNLQFTNVVEPEILDIKPAYLSSERMNIYV